MTSEPMTVAELVEALAEMPQDDAVFFCSGTGLADEAVSGLTADREAVAGAEVVTWHGTGYVRLRGNRRR